MSKSAAGLVEYASAQLGRPYWYGTFGQTATRSLYDYNKGRLPEYYRWEDMTGQLGQRVHDCVGLIKGYCWSDTPDSPPVYASNGCPDLSAEGMLLACREKGPFDRLPETPGALLFKSGHVGVYIGSGLAIEARGHLQGVVRTETAGSSWLWWGLCPYIEYPEAPDTKDNVPAPWEAEAVSWAVNARLIAGDEKGNYALHSPVALATLLTLLKRYDDMSRRDG